MEPLQPGEEAMYRRWVRIRSRLEAVLGEQSPLPAALAAYAVDRSDGINLMAVSVLREEYGADSEPSAEELMLLLAEARDPSPTQEEAGEAPR